MREKMKTFLLGACLFLLVIYIKTSCGETKISHVVRSKKALNGQSSKENFNMFISEHGSHFDEKVTFDMAKNTVTHHVPAHRDLSEADFMVDFDLNVTVTRLPENGFCYLTPRSPDEPSMDLLRKSMSMVSSGKYKIREGARVFSKLMPTGLADRSELSKNVIEFCRGMPIYEMKKTEQDRVNVRKGAVKTKRYMPIADGITQFPFPTCKPVEQYKLDKCRTTSQDYDMKCKFSLGTCVHWITCPGGLSEVTKKGGYCGSKHVYNNAICCDMYCPKQ